VDIQNRNTDALRNEIKSTMVMADRRKVKYIIETDLLTPQLIRFVVNTIKDCAYHNNVMIKTSTGYINGGVGATIQNIWTISKLIEDTPFKIKASGGIKTKDDAYKMITAGADRIGTSSGVEIVSQ
jgi:deoxyribose-phosphate aldolase